MDSRLLASNGTVAARELQGQVQAERFVEGETCRITSPVADLRCDLTKPGLDRQLIYGDRFRVLDRNGDFAFGQAERGGYVGHIRTADLGPWTAPTHVVAVRDSFGFSAPSFKTPGPLSLTLGAQIVVTEIENGYAQSCDGLFIPERHLAPIDQPMSDPVNVAEKLIGAPYLWGGNSARGIDCSGLVQAGCILSGIACPGDSDLQQKSLGTHLPEDAPLQRGDLMFWKGHVAWLSDAETLLHANAYHMAVSYEPLQDAINRIKAQGDGLPTARKRLG